MIISPNFKSYLTYLYLIYGLYTFTGCSDNLTSNKTINKGTSDSIKREKYYQWTENIPRLSFKKDSSDALQYLIQHSDTSLSRLIADSYFNVLKPYSDYSGSPQELSQFLYVLDLNGDRLKDVLFVGPSGGEPFKTSIFLFIEEHYEQIFEGYTQPLSIHISNDSLLRFCLYNPGCCADPVITEHHYFVKHSNNKLIISSDSVIGYLSQTEAPINQKLLSSRLFETITTNMPLRFQTYELDSTELDMIGANGTVIGYFPTGSKGYATAIKTERNREWAYVTMLTPPISKYNFFFDSEERNATHIKGWVLLKDISFGKPTLKNVKPNN
ncbi:MAG: hypothetical protein QM534_12905 [Sediminibacterium sp.]|nr:hypothetical protein [Sediminibacterium sp.]